jgi:hypothetical protein
MKLLQKILRGGSDANIPFDDLRNLLDSLGFAERIRGDHHFSPTTKQRKSSTSSPKARKPNLIK